MVTRIYWPKRLLSNFGENEPSLLVGWRDSPNDFVVTAALPFLDVSVANKLFAHDMLFEGLKNPSELYLRYGGTRLTVIATCNHFQPNCFFQVYTSANLAIPKIIFEQQQYVQLIYYTSPNAKWMKYLSLSPVRTHVAVYDELQGLDDASLATREILMKNAIAHGSPNVDWKISRGHNLLNCIGQINCSYELSLLLERNARRVIPSLEEHKTRKRSLSVGLAAHLLRESAAKKAKAQAHSLGVVYLFKWVVLALILVVRAGAELILRILNIKIGKYRMTDISETAQQIDLSLRKLCYIPIQYMNIRRHLKSWPTPERNLEYIRLSNNTWLIANDTIYGLFFRRVLSDNRDFIISTLFYLTQGVFGDTYKQLVLWLMSWPAGFKLNNELAAFFGEVFVWIILAWQKIMLIFGGKASWIISMLGFAGWGGLTLQISMLYDIVSLITLQVYCFHRASSKIYNNLLSVLSSLFRLFRGKKMNKLRNRVDSGDYDLYELLLGTIFFTVILFLLPTVLAFHLAFTLTRIVVLTAQVLLELTLVFLNHFPLFLILLRFKSPERVPGGIRITYLQSNDRCTLLELSSQPIGVQDIFYDYKITASRVVKHYCSIGVVRGLLTGADVIERPQLYSLLYSMLPEKQGSIHDLYVQIRDFSHM